MSSDDQPLPPEGPGRRSSIILLVAALVFADMLSTMESSMVLSAYKVIMAETGSAITAGWLVSIYFMVSGPAAVICGRLGDMYGRKRVLIWSLVLVCLGSILSAAAEDITLIIVGRAMQGASGAIIPLSIGLLRANVRPEKLGLPLGILLAANPLGIMAGLLVGGLVVDLWHWRHVFTFSAAAAVVALIAVVLCVPRSPRGPDQRLDLVGAVLYAPAVAALLYGISAFNSPTLSHAQAAGIIAASLALLAIWVVYELRQDSPFVDLRSFSDRTVALVCVTAVIACIGPLQIPQMFTVLAQQPLWTGVGFGLTATAAGLYKLPSALAAAAMGPLTGYATTRWSGRSVVLATAALGAAAWTALTFEHHHFWIFMGVTLVIVIAGASHNFGLTNLMVLAAPPARTSEVMGTLYVMKAFGQAVGAQTIALLLSLSVVADPARGPGRFPDQGAYTLTLALITLCTVLTFLTSLALPRRSPLSGAATAAAQATSR